jgi:hypothetical protein
MTDLEAKLWGVAVLTTFLTVTLVPTILGIFNNLHKAAMRLHGRGLK